jgi:hypothetical protein
VVSEVALFKLPELEATRSIQPWRRRVELAVNGTTLVSLVA